MTSELKNCPFCGGEAIIDYESLYDEEAWFVACKGTIKSCGARSTFFGSREINYKEKAIKVWNTRHISDEMVERAAEAVYCSQLRDATYYEDLPKDERNRLKRTAKAALTTALKGG